MSGTTAAVPANSDPEADAFQGLADLGLDETTAAIYTYAVHNRQMSAAQAGPLGLSRETLLTIIDRLLALRLLRPVPDRPGWYAALDPEIAAASLISPLEVEIHHRQSLISTIRAQMGPLRPRYEEGRRPGPQPSMRDLDDAADLMGSLHMAYENCQEEIVSLRSRRTKWDDALDAELPRDLSSLRRGVRMRLLYPHAARADLVTRAHIRRVVAAGAEVRTVDQVPQLYAVFDQGRAFVPDGAGALEISNGTLVRLLADVFENLWRTALPYRCEAVGYQEAAADMQKTIARLLAEGLTDEVIARRLGISPRSCRRHIAALLKHLNSVSRFQAGTLAAKTGLVLDD